MTPFSIPPVGSTPHSFEQSTGLGSSLRGMFTQTAQLNIYANNIANFGVPGYQKRDAVLTTAIEQLGAKGVNTATNDEIGRLRRSGNPLDVCLGNKGFFQRVNDQGQVELSRDGRMRVDAYGYLRSTNNYKMLDSTGQAIRLPVIPTDYERDLKINVNGDVLVYDPKKGINLLCGRLGIVNQTNEPMAQNAVEVRQGYVEDSNVYLQQEYVGMIPVRRNFEANRQLFILQNDSLSRMIQELGRAQ